MELFYSFRPLLKTVLWGGDRISAFKGVSTDLSHVGESWELSAVPGRESVVEGGPDDGKTLTQLVEDYGAALVGEGCCRRFGTQFPLLVKLIDARQDLSVQVHPGDEMAQRLHGCPGKNEMWYVIDADDRALIGAGLSRTVTPDEFKHMVDVGTVADVVAWHRTHAGDVFYLPAGRIHTIGAGNFVAEIQQTSDITYRVFDYNRRDADGNLRQLHTDLACEAIDYRVSDSYAEQVPAPSPGVAGLVKSPYFTVDRVVVAGSQELPEVPGFLIVMCIAGEARLSGGGSSCRLRQGQTVLVAAAAPALTAEGDATLITATVPE